VTQPATKPSTDAEWARNTEQRLKALEAPKTLRVGEWVLSVQEGHLLATKPGTTANLTDPVTVTQPIYNNTTEVIEQAWDLEHLGQALGIEGFAQMVSDVLATLGGINILNPISVLSGLATATVIVFQYTVGTVGEAFANFEKWLESIPLIGDIVRAVTGVVGGIFDLEKFFANLFNVIPVGSLTTAQPNLLAAFNFPVDAIGYESEWYIDGESTRTADGTGCLVLNCDGKTHAMRSGRDRNDWVKVTAGQTIRAQVAVATDDFVSNGLRCVALQIVPHFEASDDYPFTHEGAPVTVADYAPLAGHLGWPGHLMTGDEWVVPTGCTGVQLRILVTGDALSGKLRFDDAVLKLTGLIAAEQVSGLQGIVQNFTSRIQLLIDSVVNAFTGQTSFLHSMEDFVLALLNIPFGNVIGVAGPTNLGASLLGLMDALLGGLVGTPGSGGGLADVFNISKIISSMAALGKYAWEILGIRNNTPIYTGMLPNGKSNFPIDGINTDLDCTQAASVIATYRIGESSPLGVVSWLGYGTAGITGFYCNIWKINATTGDWTLVLHSPNIVGNLNPGATPQWNFYELDSPLATVAGEEYAFELVSVGGTHKVRGIDKSDQIPDHPFAATVRMAATRNNTTPTSPPSTIAKASVVRSNKVPWIEVAIDTGNMPGYFDPIEVYMTGNGSVPIPNWCGYIDVIALGGGGGGNHGGTVGFYGEGGYAGKWAKQTWVRGVDFDSDNTHVDFVVGLGGAGGYNIVIPGANGTASVWTLNGHTLSGAGGEGGNELRFGGHTVGQGPGSTTFNGVTFVGGDDQNVYGSGGTTGGGGAGGNWISFQAGGRGGNGAGWVVFRQGEIEGGGEIPDTTPPTAPTLLLDAKTYTTVTVTATGATDE